MYNVAMDSQLCMIRDAYDLTVRQYHANIDPLASVPEDFVRSEPFQAFQKTMAACGASSGAPENQRFLAPSVGMKFLDAGCCANLASYRLDRWPSLYYGVDISPALIEAMRGFAAQENIHIGALEVAELVELPFDDSFFDIAAVVGVLEYADLEYCHRALRELRRVLKHRGRLVVDIPNMAHKHVDVMLQLEAYLGRPIVVKSRHDFEALLPSLFRTVAVDESQVMLKYFVEAA